MKPIEWALIVTVAVGSHGLAAQSLGEVAREAERQKPETPWRVITGKDLGPDGPPSPAQARAASTTSRDAGTNTPPEPRYVAREASYCPGVRGSERERLRTEHALALADLAAIDKQIADLEDEAGW